MKSIEVYDIFSDKITLLGLLRYGRNACGTFKTKEKFYVFGGNNPGYRVLPLECYDKKKEEFFIVNLANSYYL